MCKNNNYLINWDLSLLKSLLLKLLTSNANQ